MKERGGGRRSDRRKNKITMEEREAMEEESVKGEIRKDRMGRGKRNRGPTRGKSKDRALLSQSADRDQIDRGIRRMQAVVENKNNTSLTRDHPETNRTTSKRRKETTVSSFNRSSPSSIVRPEKRAITENMVSTA